MKKFIITVFDILLVMATSFLAYQIIKLNILPKKVLIPLLSVLILFTLIVCILSILSKKAWNTFLCCLLSILIASVNGFAGYYLHKTSQTLSHVTMVDDEDENSVSIIVLKDSSIQNITEISNNSIGISKNTDSVGTQNMLDDLNQQNIKFDTKEYPSIQEQCTALYNNEIDAMILNDAYYDSVSDLEDFTTFLEDTNVIYTYTFKTKKQSATDKVEDITSQPFNVLITGTDSRYGVNAISRSDVNMIATINPQTGTVLLTSIPRDYYVPEVCEVSEGCPNGQKDKLTHTGNHGTNVVKKTIESFMGIKINYTVKVSFESVINLVDALDGVDIYSDVELENTGNGSTACTFHKGNNHVNGDCALGFARERYAYENGDRQRIINQQTVLIAIAKKVTSPSMIVNYPAFMDALQGTFVTDLSSEEIQSLIQYQIASNKKWKFEQYTLNGTGDWGFSAEMGRDLYMMYPDTVTIETGRKKIEAVLNGESSDTIKETKHDKVKIKEGWEGY